jgi:hypothetical protein
MLIFGCKESKVGQGNPTKDSMSIDTDSVISGKVFTKQDIASEDTLNAVIRAQSPKSKDFDFEVFIMRGEKTVQIIPFSYPKDDTFDPNGGRKDSCLMADVLDIWRTFEDTTIEDLFKLTDINKKVCFV